MPRSPPGPASGPASGPGATLGDDLNAPSILIVHPDRKTQRIVQRILAGTGFRIDIADDLCQASRLLAHLAPILVVVDGSALAAGERSEQAPASAAATACAATTCASGATSAATIEAFFAAARARGAEACMTLLGAAHGEHMPRILGLGAVTNLLVHPLPMLGDELVITAQKLIRGDLFGAEKYLLWGTELHATTLTRSSQRAHVVADVAEQVRRRGQSARVASMAMLVTDELVSNAVHNAPVDGAGRHYRAELPRDSDFALDACHQVALRWGCDGRYLAIEVTDGFGSLDRDTILRALVQTDVRDGGGAGMGIALAYRSCDHLVFNLAAGVRTQVIALIDVRYWSPASPAQGERVPASSYNVFVERS